VAKTDSLLAKYRQDRAQWDESGELWVRVMQDAKLLLNSNIYRAVEQELNHERRIRQDFAAWGDDTVDEFLSVASKLCKQRQIITSLLAKCKQPREDWYPGSAKYILHKQREVSKVLQDLLAEILQEVTTRAVEVKSLHCRIRGQKEAKPILKALYSRHGKIERLITLFNEQLQSLPQDTGQQVVQPLQIESFEPDTGKEDMDGAVETSHFSTLIQVDVLSCLAAGDAIGPLDLQDGRVAMYKRITGEDPWFAWGLSDLVHQAI
jgi:hypothetical protein